MLEILAAYLVVKCYVAFDPSQTSFWGYNARRSGKSAEQCLADFRQDVERYRASTTGQKVTGWWQTTRLRFTSTFDQARLEQAARLTKEDLDRLLADVARNLAQMR